MLHVSFINDETHKAVGKNDWRVALEQADKQIGLVRTAYAGAAFLPACTRATLLEAPVEPQDLA